MRQYKKKGLDMLMTFHSKPDDITIYTESPTELNCKLRRVICYNCQYFVDTTLPGPICGKCKSRLVTYLAKNELA